MANAYLSVDVMECVRSGHHLVVTGSDKTPMKKNLICETCTSFNPGKTAYVAYGVDTKGFGQWKNVINRVHDAEPANDTLPQEDE